MKYVIGLLVVALAGVGAWVLFFDRSVTVTLESNSQTGSELKGSQESEIEEVDRTEVAQGEYTVDTTDSVVNWAGKKPLISGYTNSGTIKLTEGTITVADDTATGSFTIDMETLLVGLTATKPGQEGALEGHLKSERWFDVATFPTASFAITAVAPRDTETFRYDVTGDLTMKGETNEITFPATIFATADGTLHVRSETEIDRTRWGLTANSGSFFDNLADNAVDDMVALNFVLVAHPNQ